jgi:hypothetical protein
VVGGRGAGNIAGEVVVGAASGLGRGSSYGEKGGVRQFEGVEGNVDRSCTGLCGCWGHSGNKRMLEGYSRNENKNILWGIRREITSGDGE